MALMLWLDGMMMMMMNTQQLGGCNSQRQHIAQSFSATR
jgi:hypothetical protein